MRLLLRLLFPFILVMVMFSLLRKFLRSQAPRKHGTSGSTADPTSGEKLVKDPICGTYVTSDGSPTAVRSGQAYYFCSDECHDKFNAQAD